MASIAEELAGQADELEHTISYFTVNEIEQKNSTGSLAAPASSSDTQSNREKKEETGMTLRDENSYDLDSSEFDRF
jgi:hypothetical protein